MPVDDAADVVEAERLLLGGAASLPDASTSKATTWLRAVTCVFFCLVSCVLVFCPRRVCLSPRLVYFSTRSFSLSLSNAIDATDDLYVHLYAIDAAGSLLSDLDRRYRLRDGQTPKAPSDAENARAAKEAATAARRRGAPPWIQMRPRWAAARATRRRPPRLGRRGLGRPGRGARVRVRHGVGDAEGDEPLVVRRFFRLRLFYGFWGFAAHGCFPGGGAPPAA